MDFSHMARQYSRYILMFFNLVFVITGVVIISVGASVKAYYNEYNHFLEDKYFYASDFLIVIGIIIFIVAFFGFCGALKENACMTLTFSSLLIVIFILEAIVGIGGIILKNKSEEMIDKALTKSISHYGGNDTELTHIWDEVQRNFNCCGVHNYTDWTNETIHTNQTIPLSCCDAPSGTVDHFTCNSTTPTLHRNGCVQEFSNYIEGHATSIEAVGITLALIQLFGIFLSCYLSKQIRSDYETV